MTREPLRIGLQTFGSEGDWNPFLVLAGSLSDAGYKCTVNITPLDDFDYKEYERNLNIKINRIGPYNHEKYLDLKKRLFSLSPGKQGSLSMEYYIYSQFEEIFSAAKILCESSDLIISHFLLFPVVMACEITRRKHLSLFPTAISVPTGHIPPLGLPDFGYRLNSIAWKIVGLAVNSQFNKRVNTFRKKAGLHPIRDFLQEVAVAELMNFVSISPSLFTIPNKKSDTIQAIGYLGHPKVNTPFIMPKDLRQFLDTKQPVVYVTFGSLNYLDPNPGETINLLSAALKIAKVKGIVQYNWDRYSGEAGNEHIFRIKRVPHQDIFPYCSVIIHHGGAGTTQAAAFSGRPSVVVAHGIDQSYNGGLLKRQGLCSEIIDRKNLTAKLLSKAILKTIENSDLRNNAEEIAKRMKNENAAVRALDLISMIMGR